MLWREKAGARECENEKTEKVVSRQGGWELEFAEQVKIGVWVKESALQRCHCRDRVSKTDRTCLIYYMSVLQLLRTCVSA